MALLPGRVCYQLFALLVAIVCTLGATNALADSSLKYNLQRLKISPDIIYVPDGINTIRVELHGNIVKPGDVVPTKNFKDLNLGKITFDINDYSTRHTVMLLDLDRRQPGAANTSSGIYNQFTSINMPGNVMNVGQTIVAFDTPSVPCQANSKHRMLMLAFSQPQNIDISAIAYMSASSGQSTNRENFLLNKFVDTHNLKLVAVNVFYASGEVNGVCSASMTVHSFQNPLLTYILQAAMVMTIFACSYHSKPRRN